MNARRLLRDMGRERAVLYGVESIWSELASLVNASASLNPDQETEVVNIVAQMISEARLFKAEITDLMVMSVATYINSCK